jgi:cytochrome b561
MTERTGYSLTQIILHWLTAIGVITAFLTHDAMKEAFKALRDTGGAPYPTPHTIAGFTVFLLVAIRLFLRARRGAPEPSASGLQLQAATWGHRLLYALLLAVPLLGFFTWIVGITGLSDVHGFLGQSLMVVALGHALVAIWHQFGKKDGTLTRMLRPEGKG